MRSPGYFAQYRGAVHAVLFAGADWVALTRDVEPDDVATAYPDTLETGSGRQGPWLKLPKAGLQRYFTVTVDAMWRGEPIWVVGIGESGLVGIGYLGASDFARAQGLSGQEREGYYGEVPEEELSDIKVTEKDLLP